MLVFEKINEQQPYSGPARQGFSFTYSHQLHSSILFGGCKDTDLYLYDHYQKLWSCKSTSTSKQQPKLSKFHAAAVVQRINGLLVSGGQDQNGQSLDDIYLLAFKDWKWTKLLLHKSPEQREKHAMLPLSQSQMLIFGGISMPYRKFTNDCWTLSLKGVPKSLANYQSSFEGSQIQTKGSGPQGACYAQSTVLAGDRLFCGSVMPGKNQSVQLFCLNLRTKAWSSLDMKLNVNEVRFYKIVSMSRQQNLILGGISGEHSQFYLFDQSVKELTPLKVSIPFDSAATLVGDPSSLTQTVAISHKKQICTGYYHLADRQESTTIQDYLIAIKHEQILSQQLHKKNGLLEQLHKEMQNYITILNREYEHYECDFGVEAEKAKHIEDCKMLKHQYSKFNQNYEETVAAIRALRTELGVINQDFQRCIETQFDEEAE